MSQVDARLDRAAHRRRDLDFLEAQLSSARTLLVPMHRGQHALRDGKLVLVDMQAGADLLDAGGELVWLGLLGDRACFALDISPVTMPLDHPALRGAELSDLRPQITELALPDLHLAFYARALLNWHAGALFCGRCGERTKPRDGGHVRVCTRSGCASEHFPRTDPCALVLITDESREHCVLGRQSVFPRGMYSTLAGFVEPAETLEEAAAREAHEEVGLVIRNVRYLASQPWPYPASLMLGCVAIADMNELHIDAELEAARWFSRAELSSLPPPMFVARSRSLAGQIIDLFIRGQIPLDA